MVGWVWVLVRGVQAEERVQAGRTVFDGGGMRGARGDSYALLGVERFTRVKLPPLLVPDSTPFSTPLDILAIFLPASSDMCRLRYLPEAGGRARTALAAAR